MTIQTDLVDEDTTTRLELAEQWLLTSGARSTAADPQFSGGFASWFDSDTRSYPYLYPEITGYALTWLAASYRLRPQPKILAAGIAAADWLLRHQDRTSAGFPAVLPLKPSPFAEKQHSIYSFDAGVILNGLVHLFEATGSAEVLEAATECGEWLIGAARSRPGFHPRLLAGQGFVADPTQWSLSSGSYHTKVSLGLLHLAAATGDRKYEEAAVDGCDFALTFQEPGGRFRSFAAGGTNCHPHLYSAEGLWVAGRYLDRPDYLAASAVATVWQFGVRSPSGEVARHWHNGTANYHERVDVIAQTLRLGVIHRAEGTIAESIISAADLSGVADRLWAAQRLDSDPAIRGGFSFGSLSDGTPAPHVNVWVTLFATQALRLFEDYRNDRWTMQPFDMV
jgi:hypothetical protein